MDRPDAYYKMAAACLSGTFAVALLAGNPRHRANRFLFVFLAAIAGNQTVEAIRVFIVDPGWNAVLFRAATVFAALDPIALYGFAAVHPRASDLGRPWKVGLVAGGGAILAVASLGIFSRGAGAPIVLSDYSIVVRAAWAAYTAIVYLVVLERFLRPLLAGESDPGLRLLFCAMSCAALPTIPRAMHDPAHLLARALDLRLLSPGYAALVLLPVGLAAASMAWLSTTSMAPRIICIVRWRAAPHAAGQPASSLLSHVKR